MNDEGDRVCIDISKRLTYESAEIYDADTEPGILNPLVRRFQRIDGIKKITIRPYQIILFVPNEIVYAAARPEIEDIIKRYA
ncbi:MAG: hypothetical protein WCL23_05980 [Candidatus Moraniibacteriota bacterium]